MTTRHTTALMLRWALAPLLALASQGAAAQSCLTSVVAPVFGNYSGASNGSFSNGSITVTCVVLGVLGQDLHYTVRLGPGNQASGTQRRMASGNNRIDYNFHCDAAYQTIWGDGSNSTCIASGGQNGLIGQLVSIYPVYGRIPGGQFVNAGTYNDSVTIQVLY